MTKRAPDLRAPVLLGQPSEGYPQDGYLVALDRAALGPGLSLQAATGRTVLKVLVKADGTVGEVDVMTSSGHPVLDRAAVGAAWGWHFQAATRDGAPVDAWAIIPVRFAVP